MSVYLDMARRCRSKAQRWRAIGDRRRALMYHGQALWALQMVRMYRGLA